MNGTRCYPRLRKDPVVERWILIAPERAARPTEVDAPAHLAHHDTCPFCAGHEAETTPEVLALRDPGTAPNTPGWRVRVVPNLYPAVGRDTAARPLEDDLFVARPGSGAHEVIIECPRHESSVTALPVGHFRDLLGVYRDRLAALGRDPRLEYAQVFKNHGADAGASLEHAHSQILALPLVPPGVRDELDAAADYHRRHGRCVYCDLLERELATGERIVLAGKECVAVAAFAGRFPYETWVLPRRHDSHYERLTATELDDLAAVLHSVLRRLEQVAGPVCYNYVLHTAPLHTPSLDGYHWHWEVLPRVTGIAGFELATGTYINTLSPEEAAERLRAEI